MASQADDEARRGAAERESWWQDGYEFGRAEMKRELMCGRVAGAPIAHTPPTEPEAEAFWSYHLGRVKDGHYE